MNCPRWLVGTLPVVLTSGMLSVGSYAAASSSVPLAAAHIAVPFAPDPSLIRAAGEPNGSVVVGFGQGGVAPRGDALVRLQAAGTRDTSFGTGGTVTLGPGDIVGSDAIAVDGAGRVLFAGGTLTGLDGTVERLSADGHRDTSFTSSGLAALRAGSGLVTDMAPDGSGGLWVASSKTLAGNAVAEHVGLLTHLRENGSTAASVSAPGSARVTVLADGRVVAVGSPIGAGPDRPTYLAV